MASVVEEELDVPAFVIRYRGTALLVQATELCAAERVELGTALLAAACARRDGSGVDRGPARV